MTRDEASEILELSPHAAPNERTAQYDTLRRQLEDKLAKAPTPGLREKYRTSLKQLEEAYALLSQTDDSAALPVLQRQRSEAGGMRPEGKPQPEGSTPHSTPSPSSLPPQASPARRKSGGKEFTLVAIIAFAVLAAGGWFVMKTRADNAEQARLAAEALHQREAGQKTEANRVNTLKTSLRTRLAEARVDWEAHESELQDAERRTSELKSELRGLRDILPEKKAELSAQVSAQEIYSKWLKNHLLRHPAKLARVRAEELLQAGALDEAAGVVDEISTALAALTRDIADRRTYFFETTTGLRIHSKPEGIKWFLTDTYGRIQEGTTPAMLEDLTLTHLVGNGITVAPFSSVEKRGEFTTGKISVRYIRPGWADVVKEATAFYEDNEVLEAVYAEGSLTVTSLPAGVPFKVTQTLTDLGWTATGTTPATLTGVPVGRVTVRLSRAGYSDISQNLDVEAGKTAKTLDLDHRSQPVRIKVAETPARITVDGKANNGSEIELSTLPPGEHTLLLETNGYQPYRTKFTTEQKPAPLTLSFSFKQLAVENITCSSCSGAGSIQHQGRCNQCNGTGRRDCPDCRNGVAGYVDGDYGGGVIGQKMVMCTACNRKGYFVCESCTNGTAYWKSTCTTCGGDGKVSKLQLSP